MTHIYTPPHDATDGPKIDALVESYRTGQEVTPVLVYGDRALTGSHRIEAHRRASALWECSAPGWEDIDDHPQLSVVRMDDADWLAACESCGVDDLDDLSDHGAICAAIYHSTDDSRIRAALADQID